MNRKQRWTRITSEHLILLLKMRRLRLMEPCLPEEEEEELHALEEPRAGSVLNKLCSDLLEQPLMSGHLRRESTSTLQSHLSALLEQECAGTALDLFMQRTSQRRTRAE